ncbi:hypothetical protein ANME2D_03285 [Candidatus Methanoperedens nitroreducens]|uniref:Uncharacterized protein n=2 Tax=Candidatus Methanoperedens nitratireducens TaxID=1392998 RepID=A0A062V4Q2_9EURY|nr:hypothetical protein ANME2D_03285 [Candidatus Methanoperedens nitroreducens]
MGFWNYRNKTISFNTCLGYLINKSMPSEPNSDEYKLSAINTKNEVIDVVVCRCQHCNENVPKVGTCPDCSTTYEHKKTVENPETGFIHFIYECSGCPPDKRKAQKIIKISESSNRASTSDLIKSFF